MFINEVAMAELRFKDNKTRICYIHSLFCKTVAYYFVVLYIF